MKRLLRLSVDPGTPQNDAVNQKSREAGVLSAIGNIATSIWSMFGGKKENTDQMKRLLRLSVDPGTPQNDAVNQKSREAGFLDGLGFAAYSIGNSIAGLFGEKKKILIK